jgi:serine/threonine protein kinase
MRENIVYKRLGSYPLVLNYNSKVLVYGSIYSLKLKRALGCFRKFILDYPASSNKTRLAIIIQIAAAVAYIHSKNIIHVNFSTRNIFVFDN